MRHGKARAARSIVHHLLGTDVRSAVHLLPGTDLFVAIAALSLARFQFCSFTIRNITHWQAHVLSIVRIEGLLLLLPNATAIAFIVVTIINTVSKLI